MLAYLDCFSGISGDMTLGALVDLGLPLQWLKENLTGEVPLEGFELEAGSGTRHGITACKVRVEVTEDRESRNYTDIRRSIENSRLSPVVKERSLAIFKRLAGAESKTWGSHGKGALPRGGRYGCPGRYYRCGFRFRLPRDKPYHRFRVSPAPALSQPSMESCRCRHQRLWNC